MGTPFTVCLVLLAILLGAGFAFESEDARRGARRRPALRPRSRSLERRVEQIRDLRFRTLPRPAEVSPKQAQREGLEDFDRSYPPAGARPTRRC